jgi:hypothetical protein
LEGESLEGESLEGESWEGESWEGDREEGDRGEGERGEGIDERLIKREERGKGEEEGRESHPKILFSGVADQKPDAKRWPLVVLQE